MTCCKNISLQVFGRLIPSFPIGRDANSNVMWACLCSCGNVKVVAACSLISRDVQSCGCLYKERSGTDSVSFRHGHAGRTGKRSPTYASWTAMRTRCTNPNSPRWSSYGGRGITVCDRWQEFKNFLDDMGERPEGKTLDRIDVNGNYEPKNCRWATQKEQHDNQRKIGAISKFTTDELLAELSRRNWRLAN